MMRSWAHFVTTLALCLFLPNSALCKDTDSNEIGRTWPSVLFSKDQSRFTLDRANYFLKLLKDF